MTVDEFYNMTPREFKNAVEGWEEEKRERMMFERILTTASIQVHLGKKSRLKPTDIVKFHWDDETIHAAEGKVITDSSEVEAFRKRAIERKLKNKR